MQDSNLRGALTPTTVFKTGALPGSANPPYSVVSSRCQESNLVRRFIRALHRPPCSTSFVRGGRADRTRAGTPSPGPRISNPVPCHSASPPTACTALPVEDSNLGLRDQSAVSVPLDQRAKLPSAGVSPSDTPASASARIRTWDLRIRSAALCPAELQGQGEDAGRLHRRSAWPPHSVTGTSFAKRLFGYQGSR